MSMHLMMLLALTSAPLTDGEFWVPVRVNAVTQPRWEIECERVEVKGRLLTMGPFIFNHHDGKVFAPMYDSRPHQVPLQGACADEFPDAPRFKSRDACVQAKGPVTAPCAGGDCASRGPFVALPTCEPELRALTELAGLALGVEHDDARKTMERLTALMKKGGTLWQREGCEAVAVTPGKGGADDAARPRLGNGRVPGAAAWSCAHSRDSRVA